MNKRSLSKNNVRNLDEARNTIIERYHGTSLNIKTASRIVNEINELLEGRIIVVDKSSMGDYRNGIINLEPYLCCDSRYTFRVGVSQEEIEEIELDIGEAVNKIYTSGGIRDLFSNLENNEANRSRIIQHIKSNISHRNVHIYDVSIDHYAATKCAVFMVLYKGQTFFVSLMPATFDIVIGTPIG